MWKRRNELKRERREYRTAEEVLAEQERADLEASGIATRDGRAAPAQAARAAPALDTARAARPLPALFALDAALRPSIRTLRMV